MPIAVMPSSAAMTIGKKPGPGNATVPAGICHAVQMTQAASASLLGVLQPHVSDLVRYRLDRYSVERLMEFLVRLGRDVEIRVRPRTGRATRPAVRVLHVT